MTPAEHTEIAAKASPIVAIAGLSFFGIQLADWEYIIAMIYSLFLLFVLIRDKIWHYHDKQNLARLGRIDERRRKR